MQFELAPFALAEGYGESILPIADLKAHLRIEADETEEDSLLEIYRDAAIDMVERYCSIRLGPCVDVTWKAESLSGPVRLGVWPVTEIRSIAWLDSDGEEVTGDVSIWRIVRRDEIALKPGATLPGGIAAGVEIKFNCGFADNDRPAVLVQAAKMFAAHLYANREAVSASGQMGGEIPLGFSQLCARYRMPVI